MLRETAEFLEIQLGHMRSRWRPDKKRPEPRKKQDHPLPKLLPAAPYSDDYSAW